MMRNTALVVFLASLICTNYCLGKQERRTLEPRRDCRLEGIDPLLIVTYKNTTVTAEETNVVHGDKVYIRCEDLGKYKLVGDSLLQCRNGYWSGNLPYCLPTTAISNYSVDAPPTIIYGLPSGSAAVEPTGALAVFPGSILHLECLFARKLGNPAWTWTSTYRQYLTGWAISAYERDWKYRLSIYYAKAQDSGVYTCTTPKNLTNSINLHVVGVHCPSLRKIPDPLIAKIEGLKVGESAIFECPPGFRLEGTSTITCQYNGKWSNKMPTCEAIICPEIRPNNAKLQVLESNNTFGGLTSFSCMWGYQLIGPQTIKCTEEGAWSGSVPTCTEIICSPPQPPKNGRIVENEKPKSSKKRDPDVHRIGALVNFSCYPGHQLIGHNTIVCTQNGTWTFATPMCDPRCPYPGDPKNGRLAPLKFWYKPGDTIQVSCDPGYVTPLEPVHRPTCRESGVWSGPPPPCNSYTNVR